MTHIDLDDVRALIDDEAERARRDMPPVEALISAASTRQKRRRGATLGTTLGVAAVIGGVGLTWGVGRAPVDNASSPSSFQAAEPSASQLPEAARPDQVAERIAESLRAQGRDGGATWNPDDGTLDIYVAGPDLGKSAAVEKVRTLADEVTRGSNVKVQVHAGGTRTEPQLVSTMDEVSDTKSYDSKGSVSIRAQRIDYKTGQVEVDVASQEAANLVEKEFGDAVRAQVKDPVTQEERDEMFGMDNVPAPAPSGSSNLHMLYANTLDSDTYGIYSCSTNGSGGVCDHGHVEYNAQLWPDLSGTQRQSLACHETGHSVGLAHPLGSGQQDDPNILQCMVQAGWPMYLGTTTSGT